MFKKVLKGLATSAQELTSSAVDATSAIGSIVGSYTSGDDIQKEDIKKLIGAGFTIVEIASFFGVAERVIKEILEE